MAKPSVKQHLAAIRQLFDYLVTGGILPSKPLGRYADRYFPAMRCVSFLSP
jgi:hypothetical protein